MEKIKISFFDNFPIELREVIKHELGELWVDYNVTDRPLSNDFIIPTLILSISFITKPFFTAFLSELGKDTYNWVKAKIGLFKVKERSPLQVSYRIYIGDTCFYDYNAYAYSESRHEGVIKAIKQVIEKCPNDSIEFVKTAILKYDTEKQRYISAELYSTESIHGDKTMRKLGIEPLIIKLD